MKDRLKIFIIYEGEQVITALKKIDANKSGFVLITDADGRFLGTLTDGDIRRALIKGLDIQDAVDGIYIRNAKKLRLSDDINRAIELFKDQTIDFLPIVDDNDYLCNVMKKKELHTIMTKDIHADLSYDFDSLDTSLLDQEIYPRPWGFFKTTVMNDFYRSKVLSVRPGEQISLQSHARREEHWIIVHGTGVAIVGDNTYRVTCGSAVFIPKGVRHTLVNLDDKESLIINEVQIGDYLGEDDLIRYDDVYGRD